MMMSIAKEWLESLYEQVQGLSGAVVPILGASDRSNPQAYVVGSSVHVSFEGGFYLFTAQHVITENKHTSLYLSADQRPHLLSGEFSTSAAHDLAVYRLPEALTAMLGTSLTIERPAPAEVDNLFGVVVGFPATKAKVKYDKGLTPYRQPIGCMVRKADHDNLYLEFDRNHSVTLESATPGKAPDPHGMSGGAIFTTPICADPRARLDGLVVEWHRDTRTFWGVRLPIAFALIDALAGVT